MTGIHNGYYCIINYDDGRHIISWSHGRMTGRWERGCGSNVGEINLELNRVAMASAVENCFARMVEWDIVSVGRQWPWLCLWWLPNTVGQEADLMVVVYDVVEVWRTETLGFICLLCVSRYLGKIRPVCISSVTEKCTTNLTDHLWSAFVYVGMLRHNCCSFCCQS